MGEVWAAFFTDHLGREQKAAVKLALPLVDDVQLGQRWMDEVRLSSTLFHDNIVRVYDAGFERGVPYLAMEMLRGASLREVFVAAAGRGMRLPPSFVIRVVIDIARGLHAAHEAKAPSGEELRVVHRDIAPANIFVGADGLSKVLDFGIARNRYQQAEHTAHGHFSGRAQYASPEQAFQMPIDRRSDIFSLACVLYEGLAGKPPYARADTKETMRALMVGEPIANIDQVPEPLMQFIRQCLSIEPARRPQTASEMADVLERIGDPGNRVQVAQLMRILVGERLSTERRFAMRQFIRYRQPLVLMTAGFACVLLAVLLLRGRVTKVHAQPVMSSPIDEASVPVADAVSSTEKSVSTDFASAATSNPSEPFPRNEESSKRQLGAQTKKRATGPAKRKTAIESELPPNPYRRKP
jgi:serine/threonine-protein kinase